MMNHLQVLFLGRRSLPLPVLVLVAIVLLLSTVSPVVTAADTNHQDPNPYAWGRNPNLRNNNRHYWVDSINVVNDLEQFSSLFIQYHGCVWSNNFAVFDDDGENRDGQDGWYEGRTAAGAANVGFSLYGVPKGTLNVLGGCTRGTYINSFFTTNGVDGLNTVLDLGLDTSNAAYCQAYYGDNNNNNNNNRRQRQLGSGSQDNNDQDDEMSTTMGCSADGNFAQAVFQGGYCQGISFLNTTSNVDNTYQSFNRAIARQLDCTKIWNGRATATDTGYSSVAAEVLLNARACYIQAEPNCPDPYGKKSQSTKLFALAQQGQSVTFQARYQKPLQALSYMALVVGILLLTFAYYIRNQDRIAATSGNHKSRWVSLITCLAQDAWQAIRKQVRAVVKFILGRRRGKKKKRKDKKKKKKTRRDSKTNVSSGVGGVGDTGVGVGGVGDSGGNDDSNPLDASMDSGSMDLPVTDTASSGLDLANSSSADDKTSSTFL